MKKIIFIIGMLVACVAFADHYERVGVCIPLFGVSGTVDGVTYTVETDYIYRPAPVYYHVVPPPPPRHRHHFYHHHHMPPPPPPPHHGSPPPHRHAPPRHPSRR